MENRVLLNKASSSLGQEIRQQRRLAGLTLKEVAARVGVTGAQLHRYELGITSVTTGRLVAIAQAIGVRPESLLNAATPPGQIQALDHLTASPANDVATFLEMFMSIRDPSHRDALMAVARMMSASFQHTAPASSGTPRGGDDLVAA